MLASLIVSLVYLLFEKNGKKMGFPYSDQELSQATWIYFLMENVVLITLSIALLVSETKYRITCWVFLAIQVADAVDYVLTYNEPWLVGSDVTLNTIKVSIFAVSIAYDFIKHTSCGSS